MVGTKTRHEIPTIDLTLEVLVPKIESEEIEPGERIVLPWYRRVPAPGVTGLRHYPGYGKRR